MSNYSNGKIYKLKVDGVDKVYIGSTCNTLYQRLAQHRHAVASTSQKKCTSSQLFVDNQNVCIELIEEYPCNSKQELEQRERYWIEQTTNAINTNMPTRTWKERWESNKEHNLEKHKAWIEANKEQQAEYKRQKRLANLEESRQKEREARERRKEKIAASKAELVNCPTCGKEMKRGSLWAHSKLH